jgi:hypothetical protein
MSILDQIRKLDEQKAALLEGAKQEALTQANAAIESLNELGFSYKLVEGRGGVNGGGRTATVSTGSGTRRTGIREEVLQIITESGGIKTGDIIEAMGARGNKSATQSISNAVSALKRDGKIATEGKLNRAT